MGIFNRRRPARPEPTVDEPERGEQPEPWVFAVVPDTVEQMQELSRGVEFDPEADRRETEEIARREVAEYRALVEEQAAGMTRQQAADVLTLVHELDQEPEGRVIDFYPERGVEGAAKRAAEINGWDRSELLSEGARWTWNPERRDLLPSSERHDDTDEQTRAHRADELDPDRLDELIASAGPSGAVRFDPDAPGGLRALTPEEDRALIDSIRLPEQRYADDREHLVRERDEASRNGDRDGADTAAAHLEVLDDEQRRDERADPRLPSRDELDEMADHMQREGHTDEQARAWEYLDARRDLADERKEAEQGDDPSVVEEIDAQRTALDTEYLGAQEPEQDRDDDPGRRSADLDVASYDRAMSEPANPTGQRSWGDSAAERDWDRLADAQWREIEAAAAGVDDPGGPQPAGPGGRTYLELDHVNDGPRDHPGPDDRSPAGLDEEPEHHDLGLEDEEPEDEEPEL